MIASASGAGHELEQLGPGPGGAEGLEALVALQLLLIHRREAERVVTHQNAERLPAHPAKPMAAGGKTSAVSQKFDGTLMAPARVCRVAAFANVRPVCRRMPRPGRHDPASM